jgi:hypothetical protein
MRACGERFIAIFHKDKEGRDYWIAFLTLRLGFRGQYILRGNTEGELRDRLRRLDPTVEFYAKGKVHGFDDPPAMIESEPSCRG